MAFQIVLVEPEIPPNTGNIARLCAATGSILHLVEPLGFSLSDSQLKRAGLDYWHLLDLHIHPDWESFNLYAEGKRYYLTTKGARAYNTASFLDGDLLVFGAETRGLSADILGIEPQMHLRIPMISESRSLNLSNAVAIVLYEALRQTGFKGLYPCDESGGR
ncbi:MAG: tRNA (cytidine(34)-2'-O)-methyltransferase [Symbiobacteriaceae bacterium]|nr:tRNA (cytidine(34)-2'-O)-methyltransferase [Symbiobacteriaceae bacterium]